MLLRVNSELQGEQADLQAITGGIATDSGVPHGRLLIQLAEASLAVEPVQVASEVRQQIVQALGVEALVDSAAVIGNFQRMVRIADGTGIPLDRPVAAMTEDLRAALGINEFASAGRLS